MNFSKFRTIVIILVIGLWVTGCAEGPTISHSTNFQAEPSAGLTRIFIYRTKNMFGAAIQPKVKVNGEETGTCKPNGVFSVDVPKSVHRISVSTETTDSILVNTSKSGTVYIKCKPALGVIIYRLKLEQMSAAEGESDIKDLSYTGAY